MSIPKFLRLLMAYCKCSETLLMAYRLSSQYFCESCQIDTQSHQRHHKSILNCLKWIGANLHFNPWWNRDVVNQHILKSANFLFFSSHKSSFLIEIQTNFNPGCFQSNLRCVVRIIKQFILLCEVLNWSRNSRTFVAWVQKFLFWYGSLLRNHHFSSKFKPFSILSVSKVI
jgi:hypothetical protein